MFLSTILIYIIILAISFSIGMLYYYIIATHTKKTKRANIDLFMAQFINFILYIWAAKILLRLPTFMKDPLAVLAYPSNSAAFYVATAFIIIHVFVKFRNDQQQLQHLLNIFIPVFIVANFLYEFIQTVITQMNPNWTLLIFYTVLTLLYTIVQGKISEQNVQWMMVFIWLVGMTGLALFSNVAIFGYVVGILYFIVFFILAIGILLYSNKKNILKMNVRN